MMSLVAAHLHIIKSYLFDDNQQNIVLTTPYFDESNPLIALSLHADFHNHLLVVHKHSSVVV